MSATRHTIKSQSKAASRLYKIKAWLLFALLCACAPRGETRSLDEVLALARKRYSLALLSAKQAPIAAELSVRLNAIQKALDEISAEQESAKRQELAAVLEESLAAILPNTGYGTRPALDELIKQYRLAGKSQDKSQGKPEGFSSFEQASAKLLASRTYHLLASELETSRFAL